RCCSAARNRRSRRLRSRPSFAHTVAYGPWNRRAEQHGGVFFVAPRHARKGPRKSDLRHSWLDLSGNSCVVLARSGKRRPSTLSQVSCRSHCHVANQRLLLQPGYRPGGGRMASALKREREKQG